MGLRQRRQAMVMRARGRREARRRKARKGEKRAETMNALVPEGMVRRPYRCQRFSRSRSYHYPRSRLRQPSPHQEFRVCRSRRAPAARAHRQHKNHKLRHVCKCGMQAHGYSLWVHVKFAARLP